MGLACGDWLFQVRQLVGDLTCGSLLWWDDLMTSVMRRYNEWLIASPLNVFTFNHLLPPSTTPRRREGGWIFVLIVTECCASSSQGRTYRRAAFGVGTDTIPDIEKLRYPVWWHPSPMRWSVFNAGAGISFVLPSSMPRYQIPQSFAELFLALCRRC